jgi:hypothetical protein
LRLGYAGMGRHEVVPPHGCGQARGGEAWMLPPGRGEHDPPQKLGPPRFSSYKCAAHVHRTVHFSPRFFDVPLPVTALPLYVTGPVVTARRRPTGCRQVPSYRCIEDVPGSVERPKSAFL